MGTALLVVACVALSIAVVVLALRRNAPDAVRDEIDRLRLTIDGALREEFRNNRQEVSQSVQRLGDALLHGQTALGQCQSHQFDTSTKATTQSITEVSRLSLARIDAFGSALAERVDSVRSTVDERLRAMQEDNSTKLDQ